ncbi:MAG: hypothetical protein CL407_11090 [Acidimicrobiaceae bacterium]|nr:hypothetical protein [Acidimicrobiaceae bacterium]
MLAIALNVVTILIVLYIFGLSMRDREVRELKRKMEEEEDVYVSATDVAEAASKDPLIVSRAYFLDSAKGSTGDFKGSSSSIWAKNDWLHGFPHKKS